MATSGRLEVQDSDIVCFESSAATEQGCHAAIMTESYGCERRPTHGAFPPNTLYRLIDVKEAGTWQAPTGITVNQRLLVVRATYRQPGTSLAASGGGKMCGSTFTLQYGSRAAYIAGLADIIDRPVLTMELEFARERAPGSMCCLGFSRLRDI